ncbi:MAG TPA: amidohydrolase [archaeon]|nr:amidohydrolase [archaeon]
MKEYGLTIKTICSKLKISSLPNLLIFSVSVLCLSAGCAGDKGAKPQADSIFFNGKIITVNSAFSIAQAAAIKGDRFLAVGTDKEILILAGPNTRKVDLEGRTVVPGLIEAHAHPERASLSELESPLPNPRTVDEVLKWIKEQAELKPAGEWIIHPKIFATRLAELRPPALSELDSVAPEHPVFLNGSYGGSINTAAMRSSGITEENRHPGLLRDSSTGRLNGKLQFTAFGLLKLPPPKEYTIPEQAQALEKMFKLYNQVGFTGVTSGGLSKGDTLLYRYMKENGMLTVRAFLNIYARFSFKDRPLEEIRQAVAALGSSTGSGDKWIRIGALKTSVDGGILTGTAFLREPWGLKAREIFGVVDPGYRGLVRMTSDELAKLVQAGAEKGWKMTAHCTGGGGVDLMLDAYEKVNQILDIKPLRFSIIHGNFFTPEAVSRMRKLDIIADMQPAWFYKDADAMLYILGRERIRTFQPYRSLIEAGVVVSAGSDHMVITDDKESINPYNPWLAMYSMVTRKTERGTVIMPEEAISREQALRCYTINNAYASFEENIKGSIEPGKLADLVVLEQDFLTCPEDEIKDITVKMTIVGGEAVFERKD